MLKKAITFTDLNGNSLTEDFYFNLNKAELVELEVSTRQGLSETLQLIVKEEDKQQLVKYFKELILLSYGKPGEDGRQFVKSPELRAAFEQTDAYSELFTELATNSESAAVFINGILPSAISKAMTEVQKAEAKPLESMTREELLEAFQKKANIIDK